MYYSTSFNGVNYSRSVSRRDNMVHGLINVKVKAIHSEHVEVSLTSTADSSKGL